MVSLSVKDEQNFHEAIKILPSNKPSRSTRPAPSVIRVFAFLMSFRVIQLIGAAMPEALGNIYQEVRTVALGSSPRGDTG